jgi:hypothetical protein
MVLDLTSDSRAWMDSRRVQRLSYPFDFISLFLRVR